MNSLESDTGAMPVKSPVESEGRSNFIRDIIIQDIKAGKHGGRVQTRFPPEPNGYLHIGHAKAICLDFGLAAEFGGKCNLRFDDTNPSKEETEYVDAIMEDVQWLGFQWDGLYYASDYFQQLYDWAIQLIKAEKAYVCDLSADEIREYRGTLTEPGIDSPYRNRTIEENLDLFARMRAGEFPDGAHVLRAKIDMASPNLNMRDPTLYRIRHASHHRTGDAWCIYPMYDFAHPLSDAVEGITHSICTPESIRDFCNRIGVAKKENVIDVAQLEHSIREDLNKRAPRVMTVLRPIKVVLTNYPEGQVEHVDVINNPEDPSTGTRKVPFSRVLYIERDDFMENPPKKFYRLSPGTEVRLRCAYFITCREVVKNEQGEIVE